MKIGIFTDPHYDTIPDGKIRIEKLLKVFRNAKVDWISELGDLCLPCPGNLWIPRCLQASFPTCFCEGNHDSSRYNLRETTDFLRLSRDFYSFCINQYKFIVLDANYMQTPKGCFPFDSQQYCPKTDETPYIPEPQLLWLEEELRTDAFFILFSHHSLLNSFQKRGIANRDEVRAILEKRNEKEKRVLLCLNGHDHGSDFQIRNGIGYYTVNSASYLWHGLKDVRVYPEELYRKYRYLKDLILYTEPLYAILTLHADNSIEIEGVRSGYDRITPQLVGMGERWNGVSILPETGSVFLPYSDSSSLSPDCPQVF